MQQRCDRMLPHTHMHAHRNTKQPRIRFFLVTTTLEGHLTDSHRTSHTYNFNCRATRHGGPQAERFSKLSCGRGVHASDVNVVHGVTRAPNDTANDVVSSDGYRADRRLRCQTTQRGIGVGRRAITVTLHQREKGSSHLRVPTNNKS